MRLASCTLCLAAAAALFGGCLVERQMPLPDDGTYMPFEEVSRFDEPAIAEPEPVFTPPPPSTSDGSGPLELFDPRLEGDIGAITGLRTDRISRLEGYSDAYWTDVSTVGDGDNGSGMTILTFEGSIDHPDLVPGARLSFHLTDETFGDTLVVYAIGCSGPATDVWEFDEPADEVVVEVDEDPENPAVLVYSYEATFTGEAFGTPHEPTVVRGSFARSLE